MNKSKILPEMTGEEISLLKQGKDITDASGQIKWHSLHFTLPPRHSRSYAYCSDTRYAPELIPYIQNVDLLYHEATFSKEHAQRAAETFHSTAEQAAMIAKQANAGALVLGHFSVRYKELGTLLNEAKSIFFNSKLAIEGENIEVEE